MPETGRLFISRIKVDEQSASRYALGGLNRGQPGGETSYEFIELYNSCSDQDLDISGWSVVGWKHCSYAQNQNCNNCTDETYITFEEGTIIPANSYIILARNIETWKPNCLPLDYWLQPGICFDGSPCFPDIWYANGGEFDGTDIIQAPTPLVPTMWNNNEFEINGWPTMLQQRTTDSGEIDPAGYVFGSRDCMGDWSVTNNQWETCTEIKNTCRDECNSQGYNDGSWDEEEGDILCYNCGYCIDNMGDSETDMDSIEPFLNECAIENDTDEMCHSFINPMIPEPCGCCVDASGGWCDGTQDPDAYPNILPCCCCFATCELEFQQCISSVQPWENDSFHGAPGGWLNPCAATYYPDAYCHPFNIFTTNHFIGGTDPSDCCIDGHYVFNAFEPPLYGECCFDDGTCHPYPLPAWQCEGTTDDPFNPVCWGMTCLEGNWQGAQWCTTITGDWHSNLPDGFPLGDLEYFQHCAQPANGSYPGVNIDYINTTWYGNPINPDKPINVYQMNIEGPLWKTQLNDSPPNSCGEYIRIFNSEGAVENYLDYTLNNFSGDQDCEYGCNLPEQDYASAELLAPAAGTWDGYSNSDTNHWVSRPMTNMTIGFNGTYQPSCCLCEDCEEQGLFECPDGNCVPEYSECDCFDCSMITVEAFGDDASWMCGNQNQFHDCQWINGADICTCPAENLDCCWWPDSILGDCNGDGILNILDLVAMSSCILNGDCLGPEGQCPSADSNIDGLVNILDLVLIVNEILNG